METTEQVPFITRKPILDSSHQIVSYQLLAGRSHDAHQASANIVAGTLASIGEQDGFADKSIFSLVDAETLEKDFHVAFPPEKTVFELGASVALNQATLQRCNVLRQMGYKIAIRDNSALGMDIIPTVSKYVDYVKIDVSKLQPDELAARFKNYQFSSKLLIAVNVETLETFEACKKLGFKLFQGCYFAQPREFSAKVISQDFSVILKLLNMLSNDEDMKRIEESFKQDPALSFKLLRYINSAGFGLSCEIQSIRHAITVIGTKQLFKWLTMLMVTAGHNSFSPALMKTSMIRGRFMELLGHSYFGKAGQDNLFIIGVFSLLDVMLNIPMEELLVKVDLPDTICDALLHRQGVYGPFLSLIEACESVDADKLDAIASALYINAQEVNHCHIESLLWADSVSAQT